MPIYTQAQEFKARLLTRERAAAVELLRAYRLAVARIEQRIAELTKQIEAARESGTISSSWLFERGRLENLKLQIQVVINRFAQVASLRVAQEQSIAIQQGAQDAQALVGTVTGDAVSVSFGSLNVGAVHAMAGL